MQTYTAYRQVEAERHQFRFSDAFDVGPLLSLFICVYITSLVDVHTSASKFKAN